MNITCNVCPMTGGFGEACAKTCPHITKKTPVDPDSELWEKLKFTKTLQDKCPKCGAFMYAYTDTPASDHPELTMIYVECGQCDYVVEESIQDINELKKKFTITP